MLEITGHADVTHAAATVTFWNQRMRVHLYYVDGMLLDTGPSRLAGSLIPFFTDLPIRQVVLTHHHEDHTGLAPWLQRERQLPVFIHERGREHCLRKTSLPVYRKLFWGERDAFDPQLLPNRVETGRYCFDVLETPGHADDHVALYNRENGWLFAGDMFLTTRPKTMIRGESVRAHVSSLRKLLRLDFDTLFCCHAGVVTEGKTRLAAKLAYLEELTDQVLDLAGRGLAERDIVRKLFPQPNLLTYLSGFEMSPHHIVRSILHEKSDTP